jgi:hypothetical protein
MNFIIRKNSTLPLLKLQVANDGRGDYKNLMDFIETSTIYFSMHDIETGVPKIIYGSAGFVDKIFLTPNSDPEYYIYYQFTSKDTNRVGRYEGQFMLRGSDGVLILPIREKLYINVQESYVSEDLDYDGCFISDYLCCVTGVSSASTTTTTTSNCCPCPPTPTNTPTITVTPTPTPTNPCVEFLTDEFGNFILTENGDYIITDFNPCVTPTPTNTQTPTNTPTISITPSITPTPSFTPNCVRQIVVPTLWNGATSINSNTLQLTQTSETLQIQVNDTITDFNGATSFVGIVSSDGTYTYVFTGPGGGLAFDCDFPLTFSGAC